MVIQTEYQQEEKLGHDISISILYLNFALVHEAKEGLEDGQRTFPDRNGLFRPNWQGLNNLEIKKLIKDQIFA